MIRWFRKLRIDAVLVAAIAVLACFNWATSWERSRLEDRIVQLKRPPSDLKVANRARRTVRADRTLDPHQFAWRVYQPPGSARARLSTGALIEAGDPDQGYEFTARVGCREVEDVGIEVDVRYAGRSASARLGGPALAKLLRGRWDQLVVEQAGRDQQVNADPAHPLRLLRLSLPPTLFAEAITRLPVAERATLPVLFDLTIEPAGDRP